MQISVLYPVVRCGF